MEQNTVTPKCGKCNGQKFTTVEHSVPHGGCIWLVTCENCGVVVGAVGDSLRLTHWELARQSKALKKIADHLGVSVDLENQ